MPWWNTVTILSTWTCESTGHRYSCGVDAEVRARFREGGVAGARPWALIFTAREIEHSRTLDDPALGLSVAFCAKEAVIKALGEPIDYRDCELLFHTDGEDQVIELSPALSSEHRVRRALAWVMLSDDDGECVVAVCLDFED